MCSRTRRPWLAFCRAGRAWPAHESPRRARRNETQPARTAPSPLSTSGRFCRRIQLERPRSSCISPGQQIRRRATPAKNRTEAQNPWQNRRPFPAKSSRSRRGAAEGKAAPAVSTSAGATRNPAGRARVRRHPVEAACTNNQRTTARTGTLFQIFL